MPSELCDWTYKVTWLSTSHSSPLSTPNFESLAIAMPHNVAKPMQQLLPLIAARGVSRSMGVGAVHALPATRNIVRHRLAYLADGETDVL